MLKVGIAGMPNAGKSTLFNALSEAGAAVAPYPFSTIEPNKAMVAVSDLDFEALGEAIDAPDLKYSYIQLWDIAGLIEGASHGNGLGNEFLGQMKNCDLLLHVVKLDSNTNAEEARDRVKVVNQEIALFDHHLLLKPFEKARRHTRLFPKDTDLKHQSEVFTKAYYGTRDGSIIREVVPESDFELFHEIGLISLKPQLLIANTDGSPHAEQIAKSLTAAFTINAEDVGQLRGLSHEEQIELGYVGNEVDIAVHGIVAAILQATRMKQVYTVGHLGVGQWVVPESANAVECASQLHEEMETEISGVRVASLQDFLQYKSWPNLTREGKSKVYNAAKYVPKDKQVLLFD